MNDFYTDPSLNETTDKEQEVNPYAAQQTQQPQQTQFSQTQQQQQPQQSAQGMPRQPYAQPYPPKQQPYPYPQAYSNHPQPAPKSSSGGAANAFGMVSFVIGCFILPITAMIYFNFRSSVSEKFGAALWFSMILSVPAVIFGVLSLTKKTEKRLFPILGVAFAGVLVLCMFVTYFFMVNGAPSAVYR